MNSRILLVLGMIVSGGSLALAASPPPSAPAKIDAKAQTIKAAPPAKLAPPMRKRRARTHRSSKSSSRSLKKALAENAALEGRMNQVADDLAKRSDVYWHRGDFDSVAYLLRKVVELDPSDVDSWSLLGWIEWSCLDDEKASEKAYRDGLALNPRQEKLYEELGIYLNRRKRYGEAAEALVKAVTFKDADALTWNSYAHALEGMKRYGQAAATWSKMASLFPGNPHSTVNLDRMKRKGEIK